MLRSAKVAGSLPMPASAMAAQVEKQRGWLSSPWQRITKAEARLWPLFKTPRSSSFSLTEVDHALLAGRSLRQIARHVSLSKRRTTRLLLEKKLALI
jgi:hypothetical protein